LVNRREGRERERRIWRDGRKGERGKIRRAGGAREGMVGEGEGEGRGEGRIRRGRGERY
jgi:hypothetical protein